MARPTKFKAEYVEQAKKLAQLGATDKEIADFFEVHEATLNRWKAEHPAFCESLKVGKAEADDRVERSLYHRATGYKHEAVKMFQAGVMHDTPGGDLLVGVLDLARPAQVLDGPGTYRVVRPNISAHGVDVGVYTES